MLKKHRNGMYVEMVQNTKTDAVWEMAICKCMVCSVLYCFKIKN